MKNLIFILTFFLALILKSHGTAQFSDEIIYRGKTYQLHANPLEEYFDRYPNRKPKGMRISTALRRGYIATFEVKGQAIYLKDIRIQTGNKSSEKKYRSKWVSVKDQLIEKGKSFKIDWLNEILIMPYGKMVKYVHLGYASTYSKYLLLEVTSGSISRVKKLNNKEFSEFKERQFIEFKKSKRYIEIVSNMKKERDYNDEYIESFLRDFIIGYTKKFLD